MHFKKYFGKGSSKFFDAILMNELLKMFWLVHLLLVDTNLQKNLIYNLRPAVTITESMVIFLLYVILVIMYVCK